MSTNHEVRAVSDRFYAALNRMANGDAGTMNEIWSHGTSVTTMHPIGGCEVGWDQVKEPWQQVAQLSKGGEVGFERRVLEVVGDLAYEVGTENGHLMLAGERVKIEGQRVTNVYRREGGTWKIVHHHTDLSPAMIDLLRKITAQR